MTGNRRQVIVVMAKAPHQGRVKTRLAPDLAPDQIVTLYRCMVEDTLATARTSRADEVAIVCPAGDAGELHAWLGDLRIEEQQGSGLATGLADAFARFDALGFDDVVALNSDTPHLPADALNEALGLLRRHTMVVGPTTDGGYYLVGGSRLRAELFDPAAIGTGTARDALLARAMASGLSIGFSASCYDIDTAADLARLRIELEAAPSRAPRTAAWLAEQTMPR